MPSTSPRIERGAALLDQNAPGWERTIDLDQLSLSSTSYCIVGQVYGDYIDGLHVLNGDAEKRPAAYGFTTWSTEQFEALTDKWRAFIEARRAKAEAA